jgi:hypothetical protein
MHVQQVMANVPKTNRCDGHESDPDAGGFFSRMFNRG